MNANFKTPSPIKRDLLTTFALAAALTAATTVATVILVPRDKTVGTSPFEVVSRENAADLCVGKTALDAAVRRSRTAPVVIDGAEFAAIKRECTTKTGETPAFWRAETGMIFMPLLGAPKS